MRLGWGWRGSRLQRLLRLLGFAGTTSVVGCSLSIAENVELGCHNTERAELLFASFEATDTNIAYAGQFVRTEREWSNVGPVTAIDGVSVARLSAIGSSGELRTLVPVTLAGNQVAVAFYLRGGTGGGDFLLNYSADGGNTWNATDAPMPSLTVARDATWVYAEVPLTLPSPRMSLLFRLQVNDLRHGGNTGNTWLDLDALTIIDLTACQASGA